MELRIDSAGRIVLPKPVRDRLGLRQDSELELIEQPEGVLLKKLAHRPSMAMIDGLWVHQGTPETVANWDRVVEDVREERTDSILAAQR